MFRLTLKNTLANLSRFALTGLAVTLSVAFLTATLILSASMTGTASADIAAANAGIGAVVEGATIVEADGGGPGELSESTRAALTAGDLAALRAADGVGDVAGVTVGFAKIVDDGTAVGSGTAADVGRNWITNSELNPFQLVEGTAPTRADEVVLDRSLASDAGIAVGDPIQVLTANGVADVNVVGIATYGPADSAPFQRTTFFADDHVADALGQNATAQAFVEFDAGVDPAIATQSLAAALPDVSVSTGADYIAAQQNAVTSPFAFLSILLIAFAAIATAVGATIIYNTFAIAIAQRRRELALLRAVGAERRQVLGSVMGEAALIGTVASAAGIALGIVSVGIMQAVMGSLGLTFLTGPTIITTFTLGIAVGVGLVITMASAWGPARRAASTAPIEALRDAAIESAGGSKLRAWSGMTCLTLGAAGLVGAVIMSNTLLLAAAVLLIPGLILGGPLLVQAAVKVAQPVLNRAAGIEGSIAATNLQRNPRRASSTSLALTLGVALIGFFTILASTFTASVTSNLTTAISADHVITSVSPEVATIDPGLADRLRAIDGVTAVAPVAQTEGAVNGEPATLGTIDVADMPMVFDLGLIDGDLSALANGGVAVVDDPSVIGPDIGDTVDVRLTNGSTALTVVAIVENSLGGFDAPTHFVADTTLADNATLDTVIYLSTTDQATIDAVQDAVAATPGSLLANRAEYLANASTEVDAFRNFIYSMLGLTLIVALVGIANTTALSISERRREIGLLQAVGTTRTGVRRIIRYEAMLLAALGTITGLTVALAGSWALIAVVGGTELGTIAIPWISLAIIGTGAVLAGTATAAAPAWKASRQPTLQAIAA